MRMGKRITRGMFVMVLLVGCGPVDDGELAVSDEELGIVQQPVLEEDFAPNTPSLAQRDSFTVDNIAQRRGHGTTTNQRLVCNLSRSPTNWSVTTPSGSPSTPRRPDAWWQEQNFAFSTAYTTTSNTTLDYETGAQDVFTSIATPTPVGAPEGFMNAGFADAVYSLFTDDTLKCAYWSAVGSVWDAFTVPHATSPASTYRPTSSPQALRRNLTTDSIYYTCGDGSRRVCEFRRISSSSFGCDTPGASATFFMQFGSASSAFVAGTRPVALVNQGAGDRIVFANLDTGGTKSIAAILEINGPDDFDPPEYSGTFTLDSGATSYSTPAPYVRADGTSAVIYLRRTSGNTEVVQVTYSAGLFSSPQVIHNTGFTLVAGTEPLAYLSEATNRNTVLFRMPFGSTTQRDTADLEEQPSGGWVKRLLPDCTDQSNLYTFGTDNNLYAVNEDTGASTVVGTNTWSSTTGSTSDRVGLAYFVKSSTLYETGFSEGARRQIGTNTWSGNTYLALAPDASNNERLWAINGSTLYRINLATGVRTSVSTSFASTTAMVSWQNRLFIMTSGTLKEYNTATGVISTRITGWTGSPKLAMDESGTFLLAHGSLNGVSARLVRITVATWSTNSMTSGWSGVTALSYLEGNAYATQTGTLYRVNPTTFALTSLGTGPFAHAHLVARR